MSAVSQPRRWTKQRIQDNVEGYLFILPWLIGLVVFTAGPMVASLYLSFTDYRAVTPPTWVGLANFERMIADRYFWISLQNTFYYTFLGVPLFMLAALADCPCAQYQGAWRCRLSHCLLSSLHHANRCQRNPLGLDFQCRLWLCQYCPTLRCICRR